MNVDRCLATDWHAKRIDKNFWFILFSSANKWRIVLLNCIVRDLHEIDLQAWISHPTVIIAGKAHITVLIHPNHF